MFTKKDSINKKENNLITYYIIVKDCELFKRDHSELKVLNVIDETDKDAMIVVEAPKRINLSGDSNVILIEEPEIFPLDLGPRLGTSQNRP